MTLEDIMYSLASLLGGSTAEARLVPEDPTSALAIRTAKHDPELHRLMQQGERRPETATVEVAKGSSAPAEYRPRTKQIRVDPTKTSDPGNLAHEVMHFLSQVSRSPFWQPLGLNEFLAEYAATAGHPEEADPGPRYQYGKQSKKVQRGLKQEYQREMAMPRDYVRPHTHEGQVPAPRSDLEQFIDFWLRQEPLQRREQPKAID